MNFSKIKLGTSSEIVIIFAIGSLCAACVFHPICFKIIFIPMVLGAMAGGSIADFDSNIVSSISRLLIVIYESKFSFSLSYLSILLAVACYIFSWKSVLEIIAQENRVNLNFRSLYFKCKAFSSLYFMSQCTSLSTFMTSLLWLTECWSSSGAAESLIGTNIPNLSYFITAYEDCMKCRNFCSAVYLLRILTSHGSWMNENSISYLLQAVTVSVSSVESFASFFTCGCVLYSLVWMFDSKSCATLLDIGQLMFLRYIADSFVPEYILKMPKQYMPYEKHNKNNPISSNSLIGKRVAFQRQWYTAHVIGIVEAVVDGLADIKLETGPNPNSSCSGVEVKKLIILSNAEKFLRKSN